MSAETRRRMVYFIRPIGMQGPIKIGCSFSPDGRRTTLQTWCPFALEIIAETPGSTDVERQFHSLFMAHWQGREWFHWSPELQAVIDQINAGTFDVSALPPAKVRKLGRPRKPWTERQRRKVSYDSRIRATTKRTGYHLPFGFYVNLDDPESVAKADAFLADPAANGLSHRDWSNLLLEHLESNQSEWAAKRRAQLELEVSAYESRAA